MKQRIKHRLLRWGAGLLSLYISGRLRKRSRYPIDIRLTDIFMSLILRQPHLQSFSPEERTHYELVTRKTAYWHGTGRLQHGENGGVVDVLHLLTEQNGLKPFKDLFDVKQGEMVSTSLTRGRMYARIYADMHAYGGVSLNKRYGSPRFWAYYFLMGSFLHAIRELKLWRSEVRRTQRKMWVEQGKKLWTVKVTRRQDSNSVGEFFNTGSDIQNNYPILIGISSGDYNFLETAKYVACYESRAGNAIPMNTFTHLEVPAAKVVEVSEFLQRHGYDDLPVFPFEQCEKWWAQQPFSRIALGELKEMNMVKI